LLVDHNSIKEQYDAVNSFGFDLHYFHTEHASHTEELTKKAVELGSNCIIAVGGDGTLNEVVNCLISNNYSDVNVALIPKGTGNDYTLSVNIPESPKELLESINKGCFIIVDVGKVIYKNKEKRYFINVADAGMGGEVTRKITTSGNSLGKWVYYKAIFSTFFTFKRPRLEIITDKETLTKKVLSVVIGKGISFGGGYKVTYDAKLNDGKFFIVVVGDISILSYLLKLPRILSGKRINHPKVNYIRSSKITLNNLSNFDCFLELDGEAGYSCPVVVECLPKKISFLSYPNEVSQ